MDLEVTTAAEEVVAATATALEVEATNRMVASAAAKDEEVS